MLQALISVLTPSGDPEVGGTGTTGQLAKWSSSSSVTSSIVTDTGTAVGIGTTTPNFPLEVASDSTVANICARRAGGGGTFRGLGANGTLAAPTATTSGNDLCLLSGRGHDGTVFVANACTLIRSFAAENFTPLANGSGISFETTPIGSTSASRAERMRITSAGNVGIGTTSPTSRIYAVNDRPGAFVDIAVQNTSAVAGSAASFTGWASGVANVFSLYQENVDSSTCLVNYSATGPIRFFANSQLRMSITADGNVWTRSGLTNMTSGFFYVPAAAGAPTGVPTSISGTVPMYYDTTNNKFYVYNGAWKGVVLT